ncbi:MAG: carotenoid 1,2-hydratase [Pseudomonadota bacterium]|uniref:lipocalin-like domain-containing protein n=1 Tax=Caldimonas aquatica TaxID=376175 RepID=UPI0034979DB6
MDRRTWLATLAAALVAPCSRAAPAPRVRAGVALQFPRDHGAHPEYRIEWWYMTGVLRSAESRLYGFQVTFFRSRTQVDPQHPSRFAASQLLFAHAAVTDVAAGRLMHDQRLARAGFGVATAALEETNVHLRDWQLRREAVGPHYRAHVAAHDFTLDLRAAETQPALLQGDAGYSRKGPEPEQASYYYSKPQLAVHGELSLGGHREAVQGRAWLDHEWSEALMHPEAVGWDWIGMNLDDGAALTAFQLRRRDGTALWAGGSYRPASREARAFAVHEVRFVPQRWWRSPLTGARYPVEWWVETPLGRHRVRARVDAQELDSRASTGAVYWEGLSELLGADGRRLGHGYLEMTGYVDRLRL